MSIRDDTKLTVSKDYPDIQTSAQGSYPNKIYKYLNTKNDCHNMLEGNIWFTGANYNRFFHGAPFEYDYESHKRLGTYALSCSKNSASPFTEKLYAVEISNIDQFIAAIKDDLRNPILSHSVSWIDEDDIKIRQPRKGLEINAHMITTIKDEVPTSLNPLIIQIGSIHSKTIKYYPNEAVIPPLTPEAMERATNSSIDFQDKNEFRIELNANFFANSCLPPTIEHLVAHIKLYCSSTRQFLRKTSS